MRESYFPLLGSCNGIRIVLVRPTMINYLTNHSKYLVGEHRKSEKQGGERGKFLFPLKWGVSFTRLS